MNPQPFPLSLSALASALEPYAAELVGADPVIHGVCQDSREVVAGNLFVVRQGAKHEGASFVEQARTRGAVALLVAAGGAGEACAQTTGLPYVRVSDVQAALGPAAQVLWGHPTEALGVVGVTGTNGKTTTVTLVRQALVALGYSAAELGTLGFSCGDVHHASGMTTPGPERVARDMRMAVELGARFFVMEVSSHAVVQRRIDGLHFRVVAFSNLTRDHLDFHGTEAEYAAAKFRLFTDYPADHRVINIDDAYGAEFAASLARSGKPVVRVSLQQEADVCLVGRTPSGRRTDLVVKLHGERVVVPTELVGEHNVDNLLLALGILMELGVPIQQLAQASLAMTGAPGRLERCDQSSDDVIVLVDYAHTPDALERVLRACRGLTTGRVLLVFGCGGDRDAGKRPAMGRIAAVGAELSWVTNDNPRSEDPERIAQAIVEGVLEAGGNTRVCLDRLQAIQAAVLEAQPGDVVLVAGKGHEDYQLVGQERLAFDDRVAARTALALRHATQFAASGSSST